VVLVAVVTLGDRHRDVPLAELQAPDGVFTRGVEAELLSGRADFAVHSLKDLPTAQDPALALAAIPERSDARDVLVTNDGSRFEHLRAQAVIGTSSPRRAAQARSWRPDLQIVPIRGNVDTRLQKLRAGDVDGLILAAAGLERLGLRSLAGEVLPVERFTPAVGQGALAVQCRADDLDTREMLARIDDQASRAAVTAERMFLRTLGGGCRLPIGGYATPVGDRLRLRGYLSAADGSRAQRGEEEGGLADAVELGRRLAERLLAEVDAVVLAEVRGG
jgi:hydroxymethylbilane synthase